MKINATAARMVTLVLLSGAHPALAATTLYTDRANFNAAAGVVEVRDLNGFATPVSFRGVSLDLLGMTVRGYGSEQGLRNVVDIPPLFDTAYDIDGTTNLAVATGVATGLVVSFAPPTYGFAADFADRGAVRLIVDGVTLTPAAAAGRSFFGFLSDTPFSALQITGNGAADYFGLDNLSFSTGNPQSGATVPEPATWALMIGGFGLAGSALRRRRAVLA